MILNGEERSMGTGERRFERHRQAWWCRPVDARDAASAPAMPRALAIEHQSESDWIDDLD